MKVKVDRNELLKKLSDIQNIVEKRNTMPVLNNFLLSAENAGSTITATDLETALKARAARPSFRHRAPDRGGFVRSS